MAGQHSVRVAVGDDLEGLVALALRCREEARVPSDEAAPGRVARRMRALLSDPAATALVAVGPEADPVALALVRCVPPSPFYDLPQAQVEMLYVSPPRRRHGLGHALLSGAADVAERFGAPDVAVMPFRGQRALERFLAKIGFAQVAGWRVMDVVELRDALDAARRRRSGEAGSRDWSRLVARRRKLRGVPPE